MKLKFNDTGLEEGYLQHYAEVLRIQSYISVSLALILYVLFGFLDLYIVPEHVTYVWVVRTIVVVCFLGVMLGIFSRYFINYNQQILTFCALVCMGGLFAMLAVISDKAEGHYYVSLTIVIPWLYVSLGLRTANAFYLNMFLLACYNLGLAYFKDYPLYIFVNNNFFLIAVSFISFTGGYLIERNRRLAFSQERTLRVLKNKAEQANLSKTKFLAAASHDLRQPLYAINLFLDVLSGLNQQPKQEQIIKKIKKSSMALDSLLQSLLDISKLDAGAVGIDKQVVKVQELFDVLIDEFEPVAREKGLSIKFMSTDLCIETDKHVIERVLRNLISNSIRYTEHGRVLVGCRRKRGSVVLCVYDTGYGISEDKVDVIFDEFHQLDNPERDRSKGLGLGLSIVKRLSELLNTKVSISSVPGKGSVFFIELPRVPYSETFKFDTESFAATTDLAGKLVVIVEDELDIRQALTLILKSWGCEVEEVTSAKYVKDKLDVLRKPDAILADYRLLNHETGVDVIKAIQNYYVDDAIPAVIITGDSAPERIQQARQSGFQIIHKPIAGDILQGLLFDLLSEKVSIAVD